MSDEVLDLLDNLYQLQATQPEEFVKAIKEAFPLIVKEYYALYDAYGRLDVSHDEVTGELMREIAARKYEEDKNHEGY